MDTSNVSIQVRSKNFASRVVKAYAEINKINNFDSAAVILEKQFLRSGTSIGDNCAEARNAKHCQSSQDDDLRIRAATRNLIETFYLNIQLL